MPAFASGSYPDNPALGPAGTDGAIENPPLDGGGGATSAGSQTDNPPLDGAAETAGAATMIANPPLEDDSAPDHAGNGENDDDGDDLGQPDPHFAGRAMAVKGKKKDKKARKKK